MKTRRDILKGVMALPLLGVNLQDGSQVTYINPPATPRKLFQVGFSFTDLFALGYPFHPSWFDSLLKQKELVPQDATLEAVFFCATQDVVIFRWRHPEFTEPLGAYDVLSTFAPSDEWRKALGLPV